MISSFQINCFRLRLFVALILFEIMERMGQWTLQDLLKFSIQHTTSNESTPNIKEMDSEKRYFLENVLKSMTVDVMEELSSSLSILQDKSSTDEEKLDALNVIANYIDHIDFANSFIKLGGWSILKEYLQVDNKDLMVATVNIIAELSQNNPFCQNFFLQNGILKVLIDYLRDGTTASNTMYAISSLVTSYEPGLAELIKYDGLKLINQSLNTTCARTFQQSCFLMATLSSEYSLVRDEFVKLGAFVKLAKLLEVVTDFDLKTETMLFAMAEFSKSKWFQVDGNMSEHLKTVLSDIIDCNKGLLQCEEIVDYCEAILNKLTEQMI